MWQQVDKSVTPIKRYNAHNHKLGSLGLIPPNPIVKSDTKQK